MFKFVQALFGNQLAGGQHDISHLESLETSLDPDLLVYRKVSLLGEDIPATIPVHDRGRGAVT